MECPRCQEPLRPSAEFCVKCGSRSDALANGSVLLGRYEIEEPLGAGRLGFVYRVLDRFLEERVAVRVLRRSIAEEVASSAWFRHQIKAARSVRSRFVCAIHDYGQDGSRHIVAMELIEGVSLREAVPGRGAFEIKHGLRLACQMAEGLQAIHAAGMVHGDLNSGNVMLDRLGQVRLMDFGMGGLVPPTVCPPADLTPEQRDLYSLGIVLAEVFQGQAEGGTHAAEGVSLLVPPPLQDLVAGLLNAKRDGRPRSAADVTSRLLAVESELSAKPGGLARTETDAERAAAVTEDAAPEAAAQGSLEEALLILSRQEIAARSSGIATPIPSPEPTRVIPAARPPAPPRSDQGPEERTVFVPLQPLRSPPPRRSQNMLAWGVAVVLAIAASAASLALLWAGLEAAFPKTQAEEALPKAPSSTPRSTPAPEGRTGQSRGSRSMGAPRAALDSRRLPARDRALGLPEQPALLVPEPPRAALLAAPQSTPAPRGRLQLDAFPFADVTVDGWDAGRTPVLLELESGTHTVIFSVRGVSPVSRTVIVPAGATETATVDFSTRPLEGEIDRGGSVKSPTPLPTPLSPH